jgi:hypothetical protein
VTVIGCTQGSSNIRQAFLPAWRLSSFVGVGSHLCAPSGLVPGGVEVDSGELRRGEEGAGPDRFFRFYFQVLRAIYKGQLVIFLFSLDLICKMYSIAEEMKP